VPADRPLHSATRPIGAVISQLRIVALALGYLALVATAWITGNDLLSAICVVVLVSAVLAPRMGAHARGPWILWLTLVGGVVAMTLAGHGRTALDLVPLAVNLALAALFGHSLLGTHTPLIARAIVAIEGAEHLALPKVAGYARVLTAAWTALFLIQALAFVLVLGSWLPGLDGNDAMRRWVVSYLHVGGVLVPALFMLAEVGFRRWYLRHVPHMPPQHFFKLLVQNWPQLLHDKDVIPERGARNVG
jgi:uncharacterized membrane protein